MPTTCSFSAVLLLLLLLLHTRSDHATLLPPSQS